MNGAIPHWSLPYFVLSRLSCSYSICGCLIHCSYWFFLLLMRYHNCLKIWSSVQLGQQHLNHLNSWIIRQLIKCCILIAKNLFVNVHVIQCFIRTSVDAFQFFHCLMWSSMIECPFMMPVLAFITWKNALKLKWLACIIYDIKLSF